MTRPHNQLDPATALNTALNVLSRAEIERAWSAVETVNQALGGNIALKAEAAACLLAQILAEIGTRSQRADLSDVTEAVQGLSTYVSGRMVQIVIAAQEPA
jgi:hypothetical protein